MGFEEYLPYVAVAVGAVVITVLMMHLMREQKKTAISRVLKPLPSEPMVVKVPLKTEHTISPDEAEEAREKLRMLELEREVLSDAIRRLYEAQAEGKITERERDLLAERYKSRMLKVKNAIAKRQSVVALHELEAMQEDLVKLFNERFDELNAKIEELRGKVEVKPSKETPEIPVEIEAPAEVEEVEIIESTEEQKQPAKRKKPRPKPAPSAPQKTDVEKRIDQIRAEVEKVLDRLGQMESET
ncbi:MAG: hypothetical protein ACUVT5_05445 [Candidatus Bathyarchaeales archaeon]